MRTLRVLTVLLALFSLSGAALAGTPSVGNSYGTDGPTAAYNIKNSYTSSSHGINSVLINPAGIARSSTFEISVGYGMELTSRPRLTFGISDEDMGSLGGEGNTYMQGGLYYTDDPNDAPTNEFKSRDLKFAVDYEHAGGITDFGVAYNFGDVLAFGISRSRPALFDFGLTTYAPTIFRNTVDMLGSTVETGTASFYISDDPSTRGCAFYDDSGGTGIVTSTAAALYDKFTNNSSTAAVSTSISFSDQVKDSREIVLTVGGKYGSLLWGVNAIPISSDISLSNSFVTKTTTNSANLVYYVPDFDPGNPISVGQWFDETDQLYSRKAGYTTYTIALSPEAYLYRGAANGNYSASAMQVDLGFIWELTGDLSVSLAYENIGGANLIYRGTGVYSTLESYVDENGPPDFQLGSTEVWDPLSHTPKPMQGSEGFYLPDEFTVNLPRKGKIGVAFTKPFFFAVDYEKYFTDFVYGDMTITDVGFLKVGGETSLFGLPLILRADTKWLIKPTILGVTDAKQAEDINKLLDQFPLLPTSTTFGLGFNMFGYEVGGDFSENHASMLSIYEGKLLDFMKVLSYDIYLKRDNWDVTCTAVSDPFYLLTQNSELIPTNNEKVEITPADIKTSWIYSLKFGYRF
jgi:hypothetical protein